MLKFAIIYLLIINFLHQVKNKKIINVNVNDINILCEQEDTFNVMIMVAHYCVIKKMLLGKYIEIAYFNDNLFRIKQVKNPAEPPYKVKYYVLSAMELGISYPQQS